MWNDIKDSIGLAPLISYEDTNGRACALFRSLMAGADPLPNMRLKVLGL